MRQPSQCLWPGHHVLHEPSLRCGSCDRRLSGVASSFKVFFREVGKLPSHATLPRHVEDKSGPSYRASQKIDRRVFSSKLWRLCLLALERALMVPASIDEMYVSSDDADVHFPLNTRIATHLKGVLHLAALHGYFAIL